MDVTDKESIQKGKKLVEEKEGKLHILINKLALTEICIKFQLLINCLFRLAVNTVPARLDPLHLS